jgi:hypothetical protein
MGRGRGGSGSEWEGRWCWLGAGGRGCGAGAGAGGLWVKWNKKRGEHPGGEPGKKGKGQNQRETQGKGQSPCRIAQRHQSRGYQGRHQTNHQEDQGPGLRHRTGSKLYLMGQLELENQGNGRGGPAESAGLFENRHGSGSGVRAEGSLRDTRRDISIRRVRRKRR